MSGKTAQRIQQLTVHPAAPSQKDGSRIEPCRVRMCESPLRQGL